MSMLKELVVCKFAGCNQVYNDARFLPCGNRTCAAHIDAMMLKSDDMNSNPRMIKCHFCEKIHAFPDDGGEFPVDSNIPMLLSMTYGSEHEAAKRSFNDVKRYIQKLINLDHEDIVIDYFQRVEADVLQEKEANLQKLLAYYQKLIDDVHERKDKCLQRLKRNKQLESQIDAIKQTLIGHENTLKKDNVVFILKTLDGDEAKWKSIQTECNTLLGKINARGEELHERVIGDQVIQFKPGKVNLQIEKLCGHFIAGTIDSNIVSSDKMTNDLFNMCKLGGKRPKLLYRASRDGFGPADFHAKCDNQPRTLTLVETSDGFIFGSYASVAWDTSDTVKSDSKAFIFSLVNVHYKPHLIPVKDDDKPKVFCKPHLGPSFGGFNYFYVKENSNKAKNSSSNLGTGYDIHTLSLTKEDTPLLAGSLRFQTSEIEVFNLNDHPNIE